MTNSVLGLFKYEDEFLEAAGRMKESGFHEITLMSPIPVHGVEEVLGKKKRIIRYFAYAGAVIGFTCGFALAVFSALSFILPVGGRPIITIPPFLIIAYEFTIFMGVIFTLVGFHLASGLPAWRDRAYTMESNVDRFAVAVACTDQTAAEAERLFRELGADDIKRVEAEI